MNLLDALKTSGPSAIGPLKSGIGNPDVFYAAINGAPILKNGKFGPESSFKTAEDALDFAKKFDEHHKRVPV